jgi:mannose-6-phosphate isomerase-like protein (cupin superfamily)
MSDSTPAPLSLNPVDLDRVFAQITQPWDPHLAGELNGQAVKCAKIHGEFIWHHHDHEDELFLVHKGVLEMRLRTGTVRIGPGQFYIVPKGVEHQPYGAETVEVVLFEPMTTLNTGNVRNELTKDVIKRA